MYKPRWFITQELVPPEIFGTRGEKSLELMDINILEALDTIRDDYGRRRSGRNVCVRARSGLHPLDSRCRRAFGLISAMRAHCASVRFVPKASRTRLSEQLFACSLLDAHLQLCGS